MAELTIDDLKTVFPKSAHTLLSKDVLDQVNNCIADPDALDHFRNNLLGYGHILKQGRFKVGDFLNAVKYVTFKMMGLNNIDAFSACFPEKIARYKVAGHSAKTIHSYVHAYHNTKLVTMLTEQIAIPVYVANADVFQEAVNKQAWLMANARSEKVQSDAADSLMRQLRPPEVRKIEVDMAPADDGTLGELRDTLRSLAEAQAKGIEAKVISVQEVAESAITKQTEDE